MLLEQEQISYRRHRPHNLRNDVLHDVVGIMGEFVFPGAAVENRAVVLRAHSHVGL